MTQRPVASLRADAASRFQRLRIALAAEVADALDALAALAEAGLAEGDAPLAAAAAGTVVLAEHVQAAGYRRAPRMLELLAAVGPEAAATGADGLLAWAGAAIAHDYGVLPTWPAADLDRLMARAREAPPDVALALGCALVEICERNGHDAAFATLAAELAAVEVQPDASPFWRGHAAIVCAWHLGSFGQTDAALQRLEAAQALAALHGLRGMGATAALQQARLVDWRRDPARALALTQQALAHGDPARTPLWSADAADVRCRIALATADFHAAVAHARLAVGFAQAAGAWPAHLVSYRVNEGYALLGAGAADAALVCFAAIDATLLPPYLAARLNCVADLAVLSAADRHDPWSEAQRLALADVLRRLRELEWPGVMPLLPAHVGRLFARALAWQIEPDWVRAAIRMRRLPAPPHAPEAWPWPVTVRALGSFTVATETGPMRPAIGNPRKAPSKPLELLRLLAAHGHDAVLVDEVAEALWPGVGREGRHKVFDITVARLRRLLGSDAALAVSDHRIRLGGECVWVDVQAFNDSLAESEAASDGSAALDAALALYRGPCLADSRQAWAEIPRQRLRARLAAALLRAMRQPGVSALQRREWTLRATSADALLGPLLGLP